MLFIDSGDGNTDNEERKDRKKKKNSETELNEEKVSKKDDYHKFMKNYSESEIINDALHKQPLSLMPMKDELKKQA